MLKFAVTKVGKSFTRTGKGEAQEDSEKEGSVTVYVLEHSLSLGEWNKLRDGIDELLERLAKSGAR